MSADVVPFDHDHNWRLTGPINYPAIYVNAKNALAECVSLDECKDWKDKGAAMRVYAAQIEDDELGKLAKRVVARATQRLGELLDEYNARGGDHGNQHTGGKSQVAPTFGKKDAAAQAGLSKHQRDQAAAVARIPSADFDKAVESDAPPSVTTLAASAPPANRQRPIDPQLQAQRDSGWDRLVGLVRAFGENLGELADADLPSRLGYIPEYARAKFAADLCNAEAMLGLVRQAWDTLSDEPDELSNRHQ